MTLTRYVVQFQEDDAPTKQRQFKDEWQAASFEEIMKSWGYKTNLYERKILGVTLRQ